MGEEALSGLNGLGVAGEAFRVFESRDGSIAEIGGVEKANP
jgi:hypothetical protein